MAETLKTEDLLLEARNFFNLLKKDVGRDIRSGKNVIYVSFLELASFSPALSELLLSSPEQALQILEVSLEESGLVEKPRIRLKEVPQELTEKIRNLRAKHLNKLVQVEGIVRQASEVRPQVVNARFECPSCGTIISVLQTEARFREPSRCSCGRKGQFKLISREMVDAQRLVIEESPENLTGGEQPRRISVFLREDLVEPKMEDKTTPGARIQVIGTLNEVTKFSQTGAQSVRYDIAIEANNIVPLEETFEDLDINEEDERQILELAADPRAFYKLAESVAPSIYGYEEIKQAIVLQLFSGVKKTKSDGNKSRGDIHILLVGDPGVAKSQILKFVSGIAPKGRYVVGKSASLEYNEPLLIRKNDQQKFVKIGEFADKFHLKGEENIFVPCEEGFEALSLNLKTLKMEWNPIISVFRHKEKEPLLSFSLETGRKIKVTKYHSIFCIEKGEVKCKPSNELKVGDYIVIPKIVPCNEAELSEEIARFLGYFIADGHLYNQDGSYKIQFTLNKNEIDIAAEINAVSEKHFNKNAVISKHGENAMRITIYGKEPYMKMRFWLGSIAHKKATEKGVPEIILNSNQNARQSFFDSYIKGDAGVTKSERLMSEILYLKLQDKMIASCLERKLNRIICLKDGRKITEKGNRFDLLSPHTGKEFMNTKINFPLDCLSDNLKIFFKRKLKQGYNRINLERIDNNMLLERLMSIYHSKNLSGKELREFFGECSLEYFSDHSDIFFKEKIGREITISLNERGLKICKEIIKFREILDSDISFVKIKKIGEFTSDKEFVYDISTPENENFTAGFGGVICHNSGAGLTATVVRDEYLRGWSLEAGAMVLSNHGLVCIDELEKMDPNDRSAMHEALEQQSVTISKANIQASLRAETTVLAAGNPKFGRFDPYQTVASQIDIPPTLINRFDVVFIMKDIPDRARDEAIATHVLMESTEKQVNAVVDRELFRKYIAYSKQKIRPKLTDEAVEEIKKFYVDLRNAQISGDAQVKPLPISARQLDALIRMSEASAKSHLSQQVTKEDSKRAIALMKYYLMQVGYDYETKTFDIDRIATGVSTSQRGKIMLVKDTIAKLESRLGKLIPVEELMKELEGKVDSKDIDDSLDKLTISGDIFHPRKGFIQRM